MPPALMTQFMLAQTLRAQSEPQKIRLWGFHHFAISLKYRLQVQVEWRKYRSKLISRQTALNCIRRFVVPSCVASVILVWMHATAIDNACSASTADKSKTSSSACIKPTFPAVCCRLACLQPLDDRLASSLFLIDFVR